MSAFEAMRARRDDMRAQRDIARAEAEKGWEVAAQHARQRDEAMAQRDVAVTAASDALAQVAKLRARIEAMQKALGETLAQVISTEQLDATRAERIARAEASGDHEVARTLRFIEARRKGSQP